MLSSKNALTRHIMNLTLQNISHHIYSSIPFNGIDSERSLLKEFQLVDTNEQQYNEAADKLITAIICIKKFLNSKEMIHKSEKLVKIDCKFVLQMMKNC